MQSEEQDKSAVADRSLRVLIVDDSKSVLRWMGVALSELPNVTLDLCDAPEKALHHASMRQYDLVVIDYLMPEMTGIEVAETLRRCDAYRTVPIIMVTAEQDGEVRLNAILAGVTDFLTKPCDPIELRARVSNLLSLRTAQVELAAQADHLAEAVAEATARLAAREEEVIWHLARAIEMRDGGTGAHISRVAAISRIIAEGIGLDSQHCQMIYLAAPLHDLGKIGIRDAVLGKPGRLTPEEMAEVREHVDHGVRLLGHSTSELIRVARAIIAGHHEKWDGSGYPAGLAGEAIPIEGRVVAVADVFDALCSVRPYKKAWQPEAAYAEIVRGSGRHFDPACVSVFCHHWPAICEIAGSITDGTDDRDGWLPQVKSHAAGSRRG